MDSFGSVGKSRSHRVKHWQGKSCADTPRLAPWSSSRWIASVENLAIYGILTLVLSLTLGFVFAALLDQKIRGENMFRSTRSRATKFSLSTLRSKLSL